MIPAGCLHCWISNIRCYKLLYYLDTPCWERHLLSSNILNLNFVKQMLFSTMWYTHRCIYLSLIPKASNLRKKTFAIFEFQVVRFFLWQFLEASWNRFVLSSNPQLLIEKRNMIIGDNRLIKRITPKKKID